MFENLDNLKPFFEAPHNRFHLRELAKLLNLSPSTVDKKLENFLKLRILKVKQEKIYKMYSAEPENPLFKQYKISYNILKLIKSGLLDFLNDKFLHPTIIVFGSYAKGEDIKKSDIDLFILSEIKKEINLNQYEKFLDRRIQLFLMNKKEFERAKQKTPELINNILNGIKLAGFLKIL